MNLEDALNRRDAVVAAWDISTTDGKRELTVYDVTAGAKPLITVTFPEAQVAPLTAAIAERGVRLGHCDDIQPIVWVTSEAGIQAWDEDQQVLDARDGVLRDVIGREHPVERIAAIRGYVFDDYVHRGLAVDRTDGTSPTLCFVLSAHASSDPTYNRNDFLTDSGWVTALGSAIARWAGKPYRDGLSRL